jgi:uncharacterized membrane protein YfcA
MNKTLLTVSLGLVAGLLASSLGQSGVEFILPMLMVLGIVHEFKRAVGTVLLFFAAPITLGAVFVYYKRKQVDVKTSLLLMASYFIAGYFGAKLTKDVSDITIQYAGAVYLIIIGLFMIWNAYTKTFGFPKK